MKKHDACIVICDRERAETGLGKLPFGAIWQRLYREAKARGPVSILSARLTDEALPVVVALAKRSSSAFERLSLAARAWKELSAPPGAKVLVSTQGLEASHSAAMLEAVTAAALAATAPMPVIKSKAPKAPEPPQLTLTGDGPDIDAELSVAIDRGNHLARWLTTLPPNVLNTNNYRKALRELAKREGWAFSLLDERTLKRLNAGAFLAVTRANEHRDAGIVRLRYRTGGDGTRKRLALVGKGICFDTGGINLKQHKSMYQMHEDMQGSAVAVGTLLALTRLKVPYDIDCWLAITENQIGPNAFRPQEVVRAVNGVTIQVAHSDAEGRMVLADTLAIASREKPDLIIDFATLTGTCISALTERYCGAFTNRPEWHGTIETAGRESGERVWPFPMDEDFDSDLESSIADILHCTQDSKGDHILAARFLNRFVPEEIPWIHIDLAAGNRSGGLGHVPTDFTGFGVRYMAELLLEQDLLAAGRGKRPRRE
ncbi:MAG TPA: M17 family metallopeptidase [Steroidobacter sp.]|uniref:M17 family metallopeptidase n=1 Tax=Steroidobacter sp. TaxID=1978227 RepID=UPI002EDB3C6C